ncbi:MAG TPA: hypothetical protein VMB21_20630 [Candidatus Limnocylindria bacterium]|nr:hypothetical protein [Candidatus Limnocylindria bacterium]
MKPEQILNPEELPPDLQWVCREYRLEPNDPVFLLIAWHWAQTQRAEETLKAAGFAFRQSVDKRLEDLKAAAEKSTLLAERITALEKALAPTREEITARLEAAFQTGLAALQRDLSALGAASANLRELASAALIAGQRRQIIASALIGLAGGTLLGLLLFAR